MLEDFKRGEKVYVKQRAKSFRWCDDPSGGYSFYVDENDEPVFDKEHYLIQKENYDMCIRHCERFEMNWEIVTYEHSYWEPSEGNCLNCGKRVYIGRFTMGERCVCGKMYGDDGHEVNYIDRAGWEEMGGESCCGESWE